jgi:hypothetical protein
MKKSLLGVMFLFCIMCFGQKQFLNTTLEKVMGKNVQVIQLASNSNDFYKSNKLTSTDRIQYPSLIGRNFKIISTYTYQNNSGIEKDMLSLESIENASEVVYFDYDQYKYLSLPFKFINEKVGGLSTNESLCNDIKITTDKYSGEKQTSSPDLNDISFLKYVTKGKTHQYVSISVYDSFLSGSRNTGMIILFKSGKKIVRTSEKVDVNSSTGANWRYSVFFTPTLNEIQLFKKEEIVGVKLYIFENSVNEGETLKQYANCILITPKVKKK